MTFVNAPRVLHFSASFSPSTIPTCRSSLKYIQHIPTVTYCYMYYNIIICPLCLDTFGLLFFLFQTFFSNLESAGGEIDKGLVKRGLQFRDHLTKKFKWDFSMEPSEDAPTVVDT